MPKRWGEWALERRPTWTREHVRLVAERFRNHWIAKPGKEGSKLDWEATWQNWCLSPKEPDLPGNGAHRARKEGQRGAVMDSIYGDSNGPDEATERDISGEAKRIA